MPDAQPPADQFWLLSGDVPTGPFTIAQVHVRLAAGDATWQTPACPVGGGKWLSLLQTPGIGPNAATAAAGGDTPGPPPAEPVAAASTAVPPKPAMTRVTPPPLPASPPPVAPPPVASAPPQKAEKSKEELIGMIAGIAILILLVAVVAAAGYGIYQWVRPPTATEVCKELDAAKTAAEAKKYVTPKMYPLVDAMFADKSALDPNDTYEWTQEVDGTRPDTKLVGFRGTVFVPEAGRRVRLEAHFVVVRSDGWKVDDMVMTGVEGESLPGPVSMVDEHRRVATPKGVAPGTTPAPIPSKSPPGYSSKYPAPQVERKRHPVEAAVVWLRDRIGWGGIVVVVVLVVVVAAVRESLQKKSPRS